MGMTTQHFHTISTSCAILPPLTQICFVQVFLSCVQRVVESSVVGSVVVGVHVDVHGEWLMLWVTALYNVVAILSMADTVCLALCGNWSAWVCIVCMVYGLLEFKLWTFIAAEHGRYGSLEDCGVSNAEYLTN